MVQNPQFLINIRKNINTNNPGYGKYYPKAVEKETITLRGLAKHMIEHGLVGNRAEVEGILIKLSECIPELVAQGYGVKLEGIGIFYPTIANVKGGAETVSDFTISQNIKGVHFRFRPDSTNLDDLTTKAFGKKVTFGNGYYQEQTGPKAPKIPLAAAEPAEP